MKRCAPLPVLLLASQWLAATRAEDFQTWYTASLKWFDTEYVDPIATGHFRMTDKSTDFSLWRFGQAAMANPMAWMRAGLAYRYTEQERPNGSWLHQRRGDIMLIPHWKLSQRLSASLRHQFELRSTEGADEISERLRMRLQLSLSTPSWHPMHSAYSSNEVFHDFDRERISENRFVPMGLRFRLNEKTHLRFFYMLRSLRGLEQWRHAHVVGTGMSLFL